MASSPSVTTAVADALARFPSMGVQAEGTGTLQVS